MMHSARNLSRPASQQRRHYIRALLSVAATTFMSPARADQPVMVKSRRQYVPSRTGQVHFHIAEPVGNTRLKTPLVCLHPTAYSGGFFREFQQLMATDRVVLCPDTPGFGSSDKPATRPTISDYALAIADALQSLGYGENESDQCDVLGFHTGGFIAAELAVQRPAMVRRLVLPGIPYLQGAERTTALKENAIEKPLFQDPQALAEYWRERWEWQGQAVPLPRLLELLADELRSGPDHWWAYEAVFTYPAESRLRLVEQPTIAIATEGDLLEPTEAACRLMQNCKAASFPDLDPPLFNKHFSPMAEIVRKFLD